MGILERMFATGPNAGGSRAHRCAAIAGFVVAGALSAWAFVSVTRLPALDGAGDDTLKIAVAVAWISIFPLWIGLFLCFMLLLGSIEEILKK